MHGCFEVYTQCLICNYTLQSCSRHACMHAGNHTERRGELDSFVNVWLFVWGAAANNVTPGFLGLMFLDVFWTFLDLSDNGFFKIVDLNNAAILLVLPGRERRAAGCFLQQTHYRKRRSKGPKPQYSATKS